jgi:hypothetical protein
MERDEMAVKSKGKKGIVKKGVETKPVEKDAVPTVIEAYGVTLTLDNTLDRFADDPFFVEKTRKVNAHFAKAKS